MVSKVKLSLLLVVLTLNKVILIKAIAVVLPTMCNLNENRQANPIAASCQSWGENIQKMLLPEFNVW